MQSVKQAEARVIQNNTVMNIAGEIEIKIAIEIEIGNEEDKPTFSFLKRVRMLPSSLSTRSRSWSLFWQLRTSLMKTERPLIPDNAMCAQIRDLRKRKSVRRLSFSLSLSISLYVFSCDSCCLKSQIFW